MNEFSREIIFKVLGWGAAVYILIIGFATSQHQLFELNAPEEQHRLYHAQIAYAEVLDRKKWPSERARLYRGDEAKRRRRKDSDGSRASQE